MADSLLSPAVGITMCAVSSAAIAYSVAKVKKNDLCEKKIPVIGVTGAFVFAAQMINIAIPGTGSSGHLGGGILLAAMLGGFPALLSISAVLIIQCLFFADGGLLALGSNIFILGVIPCLVVYPLVFRPLSKTVTAGRIKGINTAASRGVLNPSFPHSLDHARASTVAISLRSSITVASVVSAVAALQLGAFSVVLITLLSGITELPFGTFILLIQPIHLAIGIMEGVITAAILCFVYKMRPEIMESSFDRTAIKSGVPMKNVLIALAVLALITGGVLSLFVSENPDGLEWSIEKTAGTPELETEHPFIETTEAIVEATAFMPDYNFRDAGDEGLVPGTTIAGIAGSVFTFILIGIFVFVISLVKRKRGQKAAANTA